MNQNKKVLGIIPARYASTRFPGKPLAMIHNRPMIQWVYEAVAEAFDALFVATDDQRIASAVKRFGGQVVLTSADIANGTERCLAAYKQLRNDLPFNVDVLVNIQGDEPLISKEQIYQLIRCFDNEKTSIATLVKLFNDSEDIKDPGQVKVVLDYTGRALYFSRAAIPFLRDSASKGSRKYLKHIGVYAYTPESLHSICKLPPSALEKAENLEQLRWIENGYAIQTSLTDYQNISVDTPKDLEDLISYLDPR